MRAMYRYVIPIDDAPHVVKLTDSPVAAAAMTATDAVEFWAEYDTFGVESKRTFYVFGTGHPVPGNARHLFTCPRTRDGLVWHLYELM